MPAFDAKNPGTVVLDSILKYGTILAGFSYVLGLTEQMTYAHELGSAVTDFPFASPKYFVHGAVVLVIVGMFSMMPYFAELMERFYRWGLNVLSQILFSRFSISWGRRFLVLPPVPAIAHVIFALVITFVVGFWMMHRLYAPPKEALTIVFFLVVATGIVMVLFSYPEIYARLRCMQQIVVLFTLPVCWINFAMFYGTLRWRQVNREPCRTVRFLIAPAGVSALQKLDIGFPDKKGSDSSPEITEAVCVVYEGDHSYAARLKNGTIVQFDKEEVWGSRP